MSVLEIDSACSISFYQCDAVLVESAHKSSLSSFREAGHVIPFEREPNSEVREFTPFSRFHVNLDKPGVSPWPPSCQSDSVHQILFVAFTATGSFLVNGFSPMGWIEHTGKMMTGAVVSSVPDKMHFPNRMPNP
jgi:hypothetical protein